MTGTAPAVPVVDLAGDHDEVGRQHGSALADRIHRTVDVYRLVLGFRPADGQRHGRRIDEAIRRAAPGLHRELTAIAAAAEVDPAWVFVVNGRSELLADGCTTVAVPAAGVMAQTWDWLEVFEDLVVVLRVRPSDGPPFVTFTEPGIPAKIGCNGRGVGVALDFLHAAGPHGGLPVHAVLRQLLSCADRAEVTRCVDAAGVGRAGNVTVGIRDEAALNLEYRGRTLDRSEHADPFAHTNHPVAGPAADAGELGGLDANSAARLRRAVALLGSAAPTDVAGVLDLLADDHGAHPLRAPYRTFRGVRVGTVATVAMDLVRDVLHVRLGPTSDAVGSVSVPR